MIFFFTSLSKNWSRNSLSFLPPLFLSFPFTALRCSICLHSPLSELDTNKFQFSLSTALSLQTHLGNLRFSQCCGQSLAIAVIWHFCAMNYLWFSFISLCVLIMGFLVSRIWFPLLPCLLWLFEFFSLHTRQRSYNNPESATCLWQLPFPAGKLGCLQVTEQTSPPSLWSPNLWLIYDKNKNLKPETLLNNLFLYQLINAQNIAGQASWEN